MPSRYVDSRALCGPKLLNHNRPIVRRPASRLAALAAAVALSLLGGVASTARAAGPLPTPPTHPNGTQRMLIPAYFSPGGTGAPVWADMCERIRNSLAVSLIIMNPPDSGHFKVAEQQYLDGMVACQLRGQSVIGYVDTHYMDDRPAEPATATTPARPAYSMSVAAVKANIDKYVQQYPGIRGIFFDEVPNGARNGHTLAQTRAYYTTLANYVHSRLPGARVVANAGAGAGTDWQLNLAPPGPIADIVVSFEDTYAKFMAWSPPAWVSAYPAASFAQLVYAAPPDADSTTAACNKSESNHAGSVFVTSAQISVDLWKKPPSSAMLACRSLYRRQVVCCAGRAAATQVAPHEQLDMRPR
jgi:hypothetical protein